MIKFLLSLFFSLFFFFSQRGFVEARADDGLLEVFGLKQGWHASMVMVELISAKHIAQVLWFDIFHLNLVLTEIRRNISNHDNRLSESAILSTGKWYSFYFFCSFWIQLNEVYWCRLQPSDSSSEEESGKNRICKWMVSRGSSRWAKSSRLLWKLRECQIIRLWSGEISLSACEGYPASCCCTYP